MPAAIRVPEPKEPVCIEHFRGLSELPEFFSRITQYKQEFIVYDDGFRGWTFRYADIGLLARSFAARLRERGILPPYTKAPHPGVVEVKIGPPIFLQGESYSVLARRAEEAVRSL